MVDGPEHEGMIQHNFWSHLSKILINWRFESSTLFDMDRTGFFNFFY